MIQLILSSIEIIFGNNNISNDQGPIPDNLYDYDYNDERLDHSVRGWECGEIPERRELKKILDILRSKRLRETLRYLLTKIIQKDHESHIGQTKQMLIKPMTYRV